MTGRPPAARRGDPARADAGEAPWLDEDEQRVYLAFVAALVQVPVSLDAQLVRDAGISHYEYLVMAVLSMAPDRTLRMSEIADLTQSALSRLSNVATRLEKRGWLTRAPDPTNGRYTLATLTDAGTDKVVASAPGHVTQVRRMVFDPLTKAQQRQLLEICRRILGAVDPDGGDPADRLSRMLASRFE